MLRSYGAAYAEPLIEALCSSEPIVSVRVNSAKLSDCVDACQDVRDSGRSHRAIMPGAEIVPWCNTGYYLPNRPVFAADPLWHCGAYYVQDASSMVYSRVVAGVVDKYFRGVDNLRYLDACAAPGGKSIAALDVLPADSFLVANEYDRKRANILLENLAKWGRTNVAVTQGDGARFSKLTEAFDIVAVDAPCSGEGMMRKEEEAVRQWSAALIADCAATQRTLIDALWKALRPGGVMIYSTCTFNKSENEDNVRYLVDTYGAESIDLGLEEFAGVIKGFDAEIHSYRFTPGHVRGEGLFVAAMRKPGNSAHAQFKDFEARLKKDLNVLRAGLPAGTPKGKDIEPPIELALATDCDNRAYPRIDLDYASAIAYLRGESLQDIPDGTPRGYCIVCYSGMPLGFVKNVGRRANNLYPEAWRLRMDPRHLPASAPAIVGISPAPAILNSKSTM